MVLRLKMHLAFVMRNMRKSQPLSLRVDIVAFPPVFSGTLLQRGLTPITNKPPFGWDYARDPMNLLSDLFAPAASSYAAAGHILTVSLLGLAVLFATGVSL